MLRLGKEAAQDVDYTAASYLKATNLLCLAHGQNFDLVCCKKNVANRLKVCDRSSPYHRVNGGGFVRAETLEEYNEK